MNAVFDTNILIDYLDGVDAAREEITRYPHPAISIITWMEVLVGASPEEESTVRSFLARFECIGIEQAIAEGAVQLRQSARLKLPDAIIRATALNRNALLITRNDRDFPSPQPGIRTPYRL